MYEDSNVKHVKYIKDLVATIKHYGGDVCYDAGWIKHEKDLSKAAGKGTVTDATIKARVKGKVLGYVTIKHVNVERLKDQLKNLRTQYSYGQDVYPNTVEQAHDMLNKHELLNGNERKKDKRTT